jgi:hypothetical protein
MKIKVKRKPKKVITVKRKPAKKRISRRYVA